MTTTRELDPANLSPASLHDYVAEERAAGRGPTHFSADVADFALCEKHAANDPGEQYRFTYDRAIWERWYAAGWGCQTCAEVLHS